MSEAIEAEIYYLERRWTEACEKIAALEARIQLLEAELALRETDIAVLHEALDRRDNA